MSTVDVLIPTRNRPAELAATFSGLAAQEDPFGVVTVLVGLAKS